MDLVPEIRFGVIRALGRTPEEIRRHVAKYAKAWTEMRRNYLVARLTRDGAVFLGYLVSDVPPLHLVDSNGQWVSDDLQPGDVLLSLEQLRQLTPTGTIPWPGGESSVKA
jgi:hypothetical protein